MSVPVNSADAQVAPSPTTVDGDFPVNSPVQPLIMGSFPWDSASKFFSSKFCGGATQLLETKYQRSSAFLEPQQISPSNGLWLHYL